MARERDELYSEISLLDVFKRSARSADKRHARGIRHSLPTILMLLLIGFLMGETTFRGICRYFSPADPAAREHMLSQLKTFLDLSFGIPSYSCFSRTLAVVDPLPIVTCYADFLFQLVPHDGTNQQHLCADGKALNAAENRALTGKSLYIVNIFLAAYHLFTYQIRVGPKSQEGKVLEQEIYDILYQDPSVVTADAMATKKAILELICKAGSDAVLPVKANNKHLMNYLLNFITSNVAQEDNQVESYLDLNGFSGSDIPSGFVSNTQCAVFDEDNRKEEGAEGKHPIESLVFFDNVYNYVPAETDIRPQINAGRNKKLFYVLVGCRWIPMTYMHGRYERREYELISDPALIDDLFAGMAMDGWANVNAVGLVTRYRGERKRDRATKQEYIDVSVTRTPYILTRAEPAEQFAGHVRNHWAIEEGHNCLDELFREDRSTVRAGNAPETCSLIRKMAYNMISLLEARRNKDHEDKRGRGYCLRQAMERIKANGIPALGKLLTHRFRSPFLN